MNQCTQHETELAAFRERIRGLEAYIFNLEAELNHRVDRAAIVDRELVSLRGDVGALRGLLAKAYRLARHVIAIGTGDGQELRRFLERHGRWDEHRDAVADADVLLAASETMG